MVGSTESNKIIEIEEGKLLSSILVFELVKSEKNHFLAFFGGKCGTFLTFSASRSQQKKLGKWKRRALAKARAILNVG